MHHVSIVCADQLRQSLEDAFGSDCGKDFFKNGVWSFCHASCKRLHSSSIPSYDSLYCRHLLGNCRSVVCRKVCVAGGRKSWRGVLLQRMHSSKQPADTQTCPLFTCAFALEAVSAYMHPNFASHFSYTCMHTRQQFLSSYAPSTAALLASTSFSPLLLRCVFFPPSIFVCTLCLRCFQTPECSIHDTKTAFFEKQEHCLASFSSK